MHCLRGTLALRGCVRACVRACVCVCVCVCACVCVPRESIQYNTTSYHYCKPFCVRARAHVQVARAGVVHTCMACRP